MVQAVTSFLPYIKRHVSKAEEKLVKPIFIFGAERSGTTMLGSLLGSHHDCVATPESQFVTTIYRYLVDQNGDVDAKRALEEIRRNFRFRLWNIDMTPQELERRGVDSYGELILSLVEAYAHSVGSPQAHIWVDHTPASLRSAALLRDLFPGAKFIHLVRDVRAVVSSIKLLDWGVHSARTLSEDWLMKIGFGMAAESYLTPANCLRVRYEDLVLQPEQTLRQVCEFVGLMYEPEMLGGAGFAVPKYTKNQHQLVGQPPDANRIDSWTTRLSQQDIEICENVCVDMLTYLGYQPMFGYRAKMERPAARYRARLADILWYGWVDRMKKERQKKRGFKEPRAAISQK